MKYLLWILLALVAIPTWATNLTISCTAPTQNTDGTPIDPAAKISFLIYGAIQGQPLQLLTPTPITPCLNTRLNLNAGPVCYAGAAVETIGTITSDPSAQTAPVCVTVPPTPATPSNLSVSLVTTSTIAYGLAPSNDGLAFLIVGSVPIGTTCLMNQSANLYHVVPRASVTYNPPYKPTTVTTVFALCG